MDLRVPGGSGCMPATLCLLAACCSTPVLADTLFRLTEVVVEQEVRPHAGRHVVRWQGDYYVSDGGVSATGWGSQSSHAPVPFDEARKRTGVAGSTYTITFHRRPDGLDVTSVYSTFVLVRHITQTGPASCTEEISATLRSGEAFFEVHRIRNHELMYESSRTYRSAICEFPPLLS